MNRPDELEGQLADLRTDLLRARPGAIRPDQGDKAFQAHKLLAAAIHRVAKLDQHKAESETDAWVRYIVRYYPPGRSDEADARLLFSDWRTSLLKNDTPGPRIAITHGQAVLHWQRDQHDRLCLNLEDAWIDFVSSVDSFISNLKTSSRRKIILGRWQKQRWIVEPFISNVAALAGATVMDLPLSASVSGSGTTGTMTGSLGVGLSASGTPSTSASDRGTPAGEP